MAARHPPQHGGGPGNRGHRPDDGRVQQDETERKGQTTDVERMEGKVQQVDIGPQHERPQQARIEPEGSGAERAGDEVEQQRPHRRVRRRHQQRRPGSHQPPALDEVNGQPREWCGDEGRQQKVDWPQEGRPVIERDRRQPEGHARQRERHDDGGRRGEYVAWPSSQTPPFDDRDGQ